MTIFVVGLIIGACTGAIIISLCKASGDKIYVECPAKGDRCCYSCNLAGNCPCACKGDPSECMKEGKYELHKCC